MKFKILENDKVIKESIFGYAKRVYGMYLNSNDQGFKTSIEEFVGSSLNKEIPQGQLQQDELYKVAGNDEEAFVEFFKSVLSTDQASSASDDDKPGKTLNI